MEVRLPLILDGATGTELQKRGYSGDVCTEQWVLEHPDTIIDIQKGYIKAGSNVVYAPTFGANRKKLEENHIFNQTAEYNEKLVSLAKKAAGNTAYVAGDLSPTGMFLSPLGEASFEELVDIYTEQVIGLEKSGVDLYAVETMMTLSDARAAVLAIKNVSDKPIFVTFTCDESGRSISGTDVTAALCVLQGMGIDAFGLNCSTGPEQMLKQIERLKPYARIPLIAKPNAGMPEIVDGKTVYDCSAKDFIEFLPQMLDSGVAIFGGCCGTTPEHIEALSAALEDAVFKKPNPEYTDLLPASTEKLPAYLPADAAHGTILSVTANLEDDIMEANESDETMIAISLNSWDDIDSFADIQYAITKPLCIVCDDADILEDALRIYQGRALYEGNLKEEQLLPLAKKYGLIL